MKVTPIIIMAIDRGAKAFKGSLGFVLSNSKSNVLLSCYGQAVGHNPLSFRSEACAFLAALLIIFLIAEHYIEKIEESITITRMLHLFREVYFLTHNTDGTRTKISLNTAKNGHLLYKTDRLLSA